MGKAKCRITETELKGLSVAQEIAVLKRLSQGAAAWLLDVTSRTIRDHSGIPRAVDDSYDGQALLTWARSRQKAAKLRDDEIERLQLILDLMSQCEGDEVFEITMVDTLRALQEAHGQAGLVVFAEMFVRYHGEFADRNRSRPGMAEMTFAEWEGSAASRWRQEQESWATSKLRVCMVCETCRKLRRGSQWIKADPPVGHHSLRALCPKCEAK